MSRKWFCAVSGVSKSKVQIHIEALLLKSLNLSGSESQNQHV